MTLPLESIRILGIHPVIPTVEQFREAVHVMWGDNLDDEQLAQAEKRVREHFNNLFLIEIHVEPAGAEFDWSAITQPVPDQPRENWQVPYDERAVDDRANRWAFFFHFLDRSRPLQTPLGDRPLSTVTPVPEHLKSIEYELP